jgi:hAT family C-terminal dimerisation region
VERNVTAAEANMQHLVGLNEIASTCSDEIKRYLATQSLSVRKKVRDTLFTTTLSTGGWSTKDNFPFLPGWPDITWLAVQATSAPSERIFSVASRVIADRRARLDPNIAGKALYVSENWKWCGEQINLIDVIPDEDVLNE